MICSKLRRWYAVSRLGWVHSTHHTTAIFSPPHALHKQGKYDEAEVMLRQMLLATREVSKDQHPATQSVMNNRVFTLTG